MLYVRHLGLLDYDAAHAFQRDAARRRISGELAHDLLLLVEHPPVVTLGRSTKPGHLLVSPEALASQGVQTRDIERGGDVTVHEPGQLVMYPIMDLTRHRQDLHWYLRQLEEVVIGALATFGIDSSRQQGQTGAWRDGRKLASIGVHAKQWVTTHGVALNVCNDLTTFAHVVPCGIEAVTMTTVAREAAIAGVAEPSMITMQQAVVDAMANVFTLQPVPYPD